MIKKILYTLLILFFIIILPVSGAGEWSIDSSIVTGLNDIGDKSAPAIFDDSGTWKLISGESTGQYNGYYWSGTSWVSDSDIVTGLSIADTNSAPAIYNDSGTLKLITGREDGIFNGYYWGGAAWVEDSDIVTGLGDIGWDSAPAIFDDSGTFKLISGKTAGDFRGFYWGGAAWVEDSDIVTGLGDIGSESKPIIFDDSGTWKLISGEYDGIFNGYYWSGTSWVSDSDIVDGLVDIGLRSAPAFFNDSGTWKLISGEHDGVFTGFIISVPSTPSLSGQTPSTPVYDTAGNARTFNATSNQSSNNQWLLNGSLLEWDNGTTAPSYTNNSAVTGTWNISLIAHNSANSSLNTTITWTWHVLTAPSLSGQTPSTPVYDTAGNARTFNATSNQSSNNQWLINGSLLEWDNGTTSPSYSNASAVTGTWNITLIAYNSANSSLNTMINWTWHVTDAEEEEETIINGGGGGGGAINPPPAEISNETNYTLGTYTPKPVNVNFWFMMLFIGIGSAVYGSQKKNGEILFSVGLVTIFISMIKLGLF